MSDNLRRYRAYGMPSHQGILASPQVRWPGTDDARCDEQRYRREQEYTTPHIAMNVSDGPQSESRVKRFARWVRNDKITADGIL